MQVQSIFNSVKTKGDSKDAFEIHGYRLLVAHTMVLNLRDLNSKDIRLVNDAKNWFDPVRGLNSRLRLEDCLALLGCLSRIQTVRDIAFSQDKYKIEEMASKFEYQLRIHQATIHSDQDREGLVIEKSQMDNLRLAFN